MLNDTLKDSPEFFENEEMIEEEFPICLEENIPHQGKYTATNFCLLLRKQRHFYNETKKGTLAHGRNKKIGIYGRYWQCRDRVKRYQKQKQLKEGAISN
jgi:hypothetical protein